MDREKRIILDLSPGRTEQAWLDAFGAYMVNQEKPNRMLVDQLMYANALDGALRDPRRPAVVQLSLGPPGVGKTWQAQVLAKLLFGSFDALTRLDGAEFKEPHRISRLIGAPHGYIGFDVKPQFTQEKLDHHGFVASQNDPEFIDRLETARARMQRLEEELLELLDQIEKLNAVLNDNDLQRERERKIEKLREELTQLSGAPAPGMPASRRSLPDHAERQRGERRKQVEWEITQREKELAKLHELPIPDAAERSEIERKRRPLVTQFRKLRPDYDRAEAVSQRLMTEQEDRGVYKPGENFFILLIDELEKTSVDFQNLLLGILDNARVTITYEENAERRNPKARPSKEATGTRETYFTNAMIICTSNIGKKPIADAVSGRGQIGFAPDARVDLGDKIYRIAIREAFKELSPELLRRITKEHMAVFRPFTKEHLHECLDRLTLPQFIQRYTAKLPITINVTSGARQYIVDEATDRENVTLGMGALKGVVVKRIEGPLARLAVRTKEEGGIIPLDEVAIDVVKDAKDGSPRLEYSIAPRADDQEEKGRALLKEILPDEREGFEGRPVRTFRLRRSNPTGKPRKRKPRQKPRPKPK